MKKLLFLCCFLMVVSCKKLFSAENQMFVNFGSHYTSTSTLTAVSVSSTTPTLIPAINNGIQRVITNPTSNRLRYRTDHSYDMLNGQVLFPNTVWVEDKWMGNIWFQFEAGSSTANIIYSDFKFLR